MSDGEAAGQPGRRHDLAFLVSGGEMGARMRAHAWSVTPLGSPEHWEHSLKAVVRVVLTSRFAMWMAWGPELTFFCNDAYLPTVGIKRDWVLGARSDAVWAEIWPDIGPRIKHVFDSGEATWDEALLLYLERSGFSEETYHTFSYSPLADDEGRTCGMLCVVAEVTERVIGERQLSVLRDLGARLATASTRANVMASLEACLAAEPRDLPFALIYLAGEDGQASNLAAVHRAGRDATRVARAAWFGAAEVSWPPSLISDAGATLTDVAKGDVGETPLDHWQVAPRQALVAPIASSESGAPVGYLVAGLNPHRALDAGYRGFIDLVVGQVAAAIARADEFERERARAEALAEIDLVKTAFFSNVSHEFRTPLTLMLGPLEDVIAQPDAMTVADVRSSVEVAHRNGLRLMRLVNALLDFSRIEAGRVVADFEATDLAAYTTELASTFRSATDRAGISLTVEAEPASIPAHVDPDMWETIVLNLLSNAFKFTFAGGISVELRTADGQARLTVRDTGTGIPGHELPKLFERFHRVEGAKGRSIEGSGIGLALVRELARLHGGDVTVESSVGAGSAFTVAIPLGRPQMRSEAVRSRRAGGARSAPFVEEALRWLPDGAAGASQTDASVSLAPGRLEHSRVLVADDNRDMRDYVQRLLTAKGYIVDAASDGRAALAAIRRERPDLLLSDVMMPGLDGFGLLRAIRTEPDLQGLPVVLLSARAGEEAQIEGLAAGADDYLVKPFSARELLARVESTLRMARLRDEAAEVVRRRTAQFETLLNEAPLGVYLVDADLRIREVNPTALQVFGEIPDLIGRSFEEVVRILWRTDYADELIATFRRTLETGEAYVASERIEDRLDLGRTEYYAWQISRIVLPDGRYGVVCYFRDVSTEVLGRQAIVRSEEALRELNATLEQRVVREVAERTKAEEALHQAQKMETIGQLTGGIAHDFNNLLTPIMGSLDLLRRKVEGNARAERLIDIALQSAERSRILIQRLLAFSRRQNLEATPVDIDRLVDGMRDLATRTLGPSTPLVVEIPSGLPAVMVDANQLELALLNLCVNARDAMPGGGTLTIAAEEQHSTGDGLTPGDYVRISVVDTGLGMDKATLVRAVEPFFSTKDVGKGTGLGLSMVHGFASQSGGAFQLSSRLGEGTRADLWLPVTHEAAALRLLENNLQSAAVACSAFVLLVDDEELVRAGTAEMLRDLGYRVMEAETAARALDLVRDGALPDILITDHAMPGMTGVRLTEELRILIPGIPTLMITGYADLSDCEAYDIPLLSKPFRQAELQSRVAELLHPKS